MTRRVPRFLASQQGLPFANCFPPKTPVVCLPTPWGEIPIGDASYGLCGGMVYTVLDCYLNDQPPPQELTPPLFRYLAKRLIESWNFPFGLLKYYDWQCRPSASRYWAGVRVQTGLAWLTIVDEWPRIRTDLDRGCPVPLGLVIPHSVSPFQLNKNHQVLAYRYDIDDSSKNVSLNIYDPNYPGDDDLCIAFSVADPEQETLIHHTQMGPVIRGLFRAEYRKPMNPPPF